MVVHEHFLWAFQSSLIYFVQLSHFLHQPTVDVASCKQANKQVSNIMMLHGRHSS